MSENRLQLKSLEMENYKSIEKGKVDLSDVSVLIGRNNSGKSNIIDLFSSIKYLEEENVRRIRKAWFRQRVTNKDDSQEFSYSLTYDIPEIFREKVLDKLESSKRTSSSSRKLERKIRNGRALTGLKMCVEMSGTGRDNFNKEYYTNDNHDWLPLDSFRREYTNFNRKELRNSLTSSILTWRFVSPFRKPSDSRQTKYTRDLDSDGNNLVQVLDSLERNHRPLFNKISNSYVKIMEGVSDLSIQYDLEGESDNFITVMIEEDYFDMEFRSKDISSGSKEILVLLTQIYLAAEESDILFLEEPELHLHPGAEQKIFNIIHNLVDEYDFQVVISTHSDVFVNKAESSSITRIARDGDTKLRSISSEEVDVELQELGYSKSGLLQSEAVVFVEGYSDRLILSQWATNLDYDLNDLGISVVEIEGKDNIKTHGRSLVKVLQSFEIPYLFVVDSDEDDPRQRIMYYKNKINRDDDEGVDKDKVWWHTTPDHFVAWEDSDIEFFFLKAPEAIANVVGEDKDTIEEILEKSSADKNVDVLDDIWNKCYEGEFTSYKKDIHGQMIAKQMDKSQMDNEIIEVFEEIRAIV